MMGMDLAEVKMALCLVCRVEEAGPTADGAASLEVFHARDLDGPDPDATLVGTRV